MDLLKYFLFLYVDYGQVELSSFTVIFALNGCQFDICLTCIQIVSGKQVAPASISAAKMSEIPSCIWKLFKLVVCVEGRRKEGGKEMDKHFIILGDLLYREGEKKFSYLQNHLSLGRMRLSLTASRRREGGRKAREGVYSERLPSCPDGEVRYVGGKATLKPGGWGRWESNMPRKVKLSIVIMEFILKIFTYIIPSSGNNK